MEKQIKMNSSRNNQIQAAPALFYDTVHDRHYTTLPEGKPDPINLFCDPVSKSKGYHLTNMERAGTFTNHFLVEEIRGAFRITGAGDFASSYIEFFIGSTSYLTIPVLLLKTPFNFRDNALLINPNQNLTVKLYLAAGVRHVAYAKVGLKGIYYYPLA